MYKASLAKEVTIETENTKGIAAKVTGLIANKAGANIRAGWALGLNGKGIFSWITDNNDKVVDALKKDYPTVKEVEVIMIEGKDKAGEVAEITDKISHAGLNIDFLYTTYLNNKPTIIVATENNQKALTLFN